MKQNIDLSTNNNGFEENKSEIKNFLLEVKGLLNSKDFKIFIKYVKILTDKTQSFNKIQLFENIKSIFGDKQNLYEKFEIILLSKNK